MKNRHTNRLIHENSPYLLQHAHNPVDWYPWGKEALAKAREEDKPILLSIGYSACHWCHVMEKESFENEAIADIMNRYFINIKVDREERPDIDEVYQYAVQLFGRGGGWPLTVFLTPEGKPFFGGTYFPPEEREGMKGFPDILLAVAKAYRERKREIEMTTAELKNVLVRMTDRTPSDAELRLTDLEEAASRLLRYYDPIHGGFGTAPKFPNTTQLSLLLRYHRRSGDPLAIKAVGETLRCMAEGGIYDQLGGGFHRYAVDERWQVPHFEKMLYDNALLSCIYLDAYKVTKDPFFKKIAEETLNYILREMEHPDGGFYSSQDADSDGEEGRYYVWTKGEIESVLGEDAEVVCRYYGVTEAGNFDGRNVLHIDRGIEALSREFGLSGEDIRRILDRGRSRLFAARDQRVKPFLDTKIITGWNGLVLSALTNAYQATGEDSYLDTAKRSFDFIKSHLYREGRLLHVWKDGAARVEGDLDDHAFLASAAIDLFEVTFDGGYLSWAERLADSLIELFLDRERGGFYHSSQSDDRLFHRLKTGNDLSLPSGNAVAAALLLRLSNYRDNQRYRTVAEGAIRLFYKDALEDPFSYSGLLLATYLYLEGTMEITIIGNRGSGEVMGLLRRLGERYIPNKVIYLMDERGGGGYIPAFARDRSQRKGRVTVYICKDFTCSEPLTEWADIERLLK